MIRTIVMQTLAPTGFAPAGKPAYTNRQERFRLSAGWDSIRIPDDSEKRSKIRMTRQAQDYGYRSQWNSISRIRLRMAITALE